MPEQPQHWPRGSPTNVSRESPRRTAHSPVGQEGRAPCSSRAGAETFILQLLSCPPHPSPCALLHCHRKNLLLSAILLLLHQLMHLIHISRVAGAHCREGRSGVTHPARDISDSNTWRTRLAARPQQKAVVLKCAAAGAYTLFPEITSQHQAASVS